MFSNPPHVVLDDTDSCRFAQTSGMPLEDGVARFPETRTSGVVTLIPFAAERTSMQLSNFTFLQKLLHF